MLPIAGFPTSLKSWWGSDLLQPHHTTPNYLNFEAPSRALLFSKFDPTFRLNHRAKATGPLADVADEVEVSLSAPSSDPLAEPMLQGSLYRGVSYVSAGLIAPTDMSRPRASFAASINTALNTDTVLTVRSSVNDVPLACPTQSSFSHALFGLYFDHGSFAHSHRLQSSAAKGNFSLYNDIAVGANGFSVGAEAVTSPLGEELRDYNVRAAFKRPGALDITVGTQDHLKEVFCAKTVHLGPNLSLGCSTKVHHQQITNVSAWNWTAGFSWKLPATTSLTLLKGKVGSTGVASLAVENDDLDLACVNASVSAPLFGASLSKYDPSAVKVGLGLTFGESRGAVVNDALLVNAPLLSAPRAGHGGPRPGAGKCPACH